jgi:hypothetical protein
MAHLALAAGRAGRLLARGSIHHRAGRCPLFMANALLPCWTRKCLACWEAHGLWDGVRAEEALRTCHWVLVTGPCAPSPLASAHQPCGASRVLVSGNPEAPLAFLALANGDAEPHQGSIARCCEVTAGLPSGALRIRHALAVSTVLSQEPCVGQAAQRRLTIRAQPAVAAVCAQPRAALRIKQRTDGSAAWANLRYCGPQRGAEQRSERQGEKQARENSQRHAPVYPPHCFRHSSVYFLSPPQNRS